MLFSHLPLLCAATADQLAPIGKRELLRLWVGHSLTGMGWRAYLSKQADFLRVIAALAEGMIKYR